MSMRMAFAGFVLAAGLFLISQGNADEPKKADDISISDLSLQVEALRAIYDFKMTAEQIRLLEKLAGETADKPRERRGKASDEYREMLLELQKALASASDEDLIEDLEDQLDQLTESEKPELDDGVEVTDAARRRAPEVLRQLKASQLAAYIALYSEAIEDPLDVLVDSFARVRRLKQAEWKDAREQIAEVVSFLVAGLDAEKAERVNDQVVALLIKARRMKKEEFEKQQPELEKEARQIVGDVGPTEVLRHFVERVLAELLSNPRLHAAVKLRLKGI